MCGVAGIIAPFASPAWRKATLSELLKQAESRGNDATGIAFTDPKAGLTVVKNGVDADTFVESEEYEKITHSLPAIVMGHTRQATGGTQAIASNNENNHPFYSMESGIAVIHNGVVNDTPWRKTVGMDGGIKHPFKGGTDSEVFLRVVESMVEDEKDPSMESAIYDACYNISGTYALAFLRQAEPDKIWFACHGNPITLGYNEKERYIVWASTEKIIEDAMADYKWMLNFFWKKIEAKLTINQLKDNHMLTIKINDKEPYFELSTRELKVHPNSTYSSAGRRHGK